MLYYDEPPENYGRDTHPCPFCDVEIPTRVDECPECVADLSEPDPMDDDDRGWDRADDDWADRGHEEAP